MIFADKLIRLRKRIGWSQEELAEKMNVSRQAVSKWESAQTIPDLQKLLQLSQLFGVTTDYLLKDEIEDEEFTNEDFESLVKRVSLEEANTYMEKRKGDSNRISLGTFLCILSPVPLLIMSGMTELGFSEHIGSVIGLTALFIMVVIAVAIFVSVGFNNAPYEYLEKEQFELEYGVKGMIEERQKAYQPTYARINIIGVCLCVLSPVPLFLSSLLEDDLICIFMVCVTIAIVAVAVLMFVNVGVKWASMQKLLQEGDYTREKKKASSLTGAIATIYWLLTTAIFLGYSFITDDWGRSWIVWPVAGVLYGAIAVICRLIEAKKN